MCSEWEVELSDTGLPGDGVTPGDWGPVCSLGHEAGEEQGGPPARRVRRHTGVQGGWKAVGLGSREVLRKGTLGT